MQPQSIQARLAAREATGDPNALWPHTSAKHRGAAYESLARLTRAVLADSQPPYRLKADSEDDVAALSAMAYRSGLGPLVGWWLEEGVVEADARVGALLRLHLAHNRERVAAMHAALVRLLDALQTADTVVTLLKGAHTSRVYFPEPGTRPSTDIDLLVVEAEAERARAALRAIGFAEVRRTTRPERSEWMPVGHPETLASLDLDHAQNPWSIDLHQSLGRWYFRGLEAGFEPSFWKTAPLEIDGRRVQVLTQPLLTAFLAMHAAYGVRDLRLIHLVELVLLIRRDVAAGTLRWQELGDLLTATRTARFVYPGLELVERFIPNTLDPDLRRHLVAASTPRMRRVIDAVDAAGMQLPRRTLDERLMWACGVRELLCNIGELVWPSDEALPAAEVIRLYFRRARMLIRGQVGLRSQAR